MKKALLALSLVSSLFISAAASAADYGVTASAGTTGVGAHFTIPVASNLNARFGVNGFSRSLNESTANANYDLKLKTQTIDALLDYYPTKSDFRLTGGLVYNGNKITGSVKPNAGGNFTLDGNTYNAATAGQIDGNINFRKIAPYLGIGYGNAIKNTGFSFSADLGIMFTGNPKSSLQSSNCSAGAATCSQLAADVAAENASLQKELNGMRFYPVARVGVSYGF